MVCLCAGVPAALCDRSLLCASHNLGCLCPEASGASSRGVCLSAPETLSESETLLRRVVLLSECSDAAPADNCRSLLGSAE